MTSIAKQVPFSPSDWHKMDLLAVRFKLAREPTPVTFFPTSLFPRTMVKRQEVVVEKIAQVGGDMA